MNAGSTGLADKGLPSAIGRWVTSFVFEAHTTLDFAPQSAGDAAGLMLFHDDDNYVSIAKTLDGDGRACLELEERSMGRSAVRAVSALSSAEATGKLRLRVQGERDRSTGAVAYRFSYAMAGSSEWKAIGSPVPADLLSTRTAGGFTGTMVGVFATGGY